MTEAERDLLELRLAEQALFKESLSEKRARIQELETEVRYLRRLLNDLLAAPRPQPQPAAAPPRGRGNGVPLRWKA